jgi:hypothetical protein
MTHEVSPSVPRRDSLGSCRRVQRWALLFVVVLAVGCASPAHASASSRTVGVLSFIPPAGWATTQKDGSGPMTMRNGNEAKDISCEITVYNALASSGDLAADFLSEWAEIVGTDLSNVEDVSVQGTSIMGVAQTTLVSGRKIYVRLITYSAGAKMASIVVVTPNLEAYEFYLPKIDSFLAGVTVNAGATATLQMAPGQQLREQTQELTKKDTPTLTRPHSGAEDTSSVSTKSVWIDAWKKSVRMSDLSGTWKYIWRDGGLFVHESLLVEPDGTFTGMAQGRGANTFDDEYHGTLALSPTPVLRYTRPSSPRPFNILAFTQLPDGSSTIHILDSHYPITEMNIGSYGMKFIRAPEPIRRPN